MWQQMCHRCILCARNSKDMPKRRYFLQLYGLLVALSLRTVRHSWKRWFLEFSLPNWIVEIISILSSYNTFVNVNPYTFLIYFVISPRGRRLQNSMWWDWLSARPRYSRLKTGREKMKKLFTKTVSPIIP